VGKEADFPGNWGKGGHKLANKKSGDETGGGGKLDYVVFVKMKGLTRFGRRGRATPLHMTGGQRRLIIREKRGRELTMYTRVVSGNGGKERVPF